MLLIILNLVVYLVKIDGRALEDDQMHIFSYVHPEIREEGSKFRDGHNEIEIGDIPQNITNEEYTFTFYNWECRSGEVISEGSSIKQLKHLFNKDLDTKIVVHGWLSSSHSYVVHNTIKVYLASQDLNMIAVDWSTLAGYKLYPVTTYSVAPVGRGVAKLVERLLEARVVSLDRLHLIGHSLGSHVMGIAAQTIQKAGHGKVARITGLDPASPLYEYMGGEDSRLDSGDAEFVDVIHTAGGAAGYYTALGHADFYPNGGTPIQPACEEYSINISCSHGMSYKYYDESIQNPEAFRAVECDSWKSYASGNCNKHNVTYMGDPTPTSTRGIFYLTTNDKPPYGRG
ncbi:pancreatic triacylglycerol lipase isoform X2 [Halyomorpha halys]|uniref:pancreatic triacylglycerol lipase isoform X2 n=1 Tax=Halyomorpha halys TaxID=286706 RepID=UPI0006D501F9|nr:pancreatic triacylglycerol lipase-like isoform X2 [Halyomorpha halys]